MGEGKGEGDGTYFWLPTKGNWPSKLDTVYTAVCVVAGKVSISTGVTTSHVCVGVCIMYVSIMRGGRVEKQGGKVGTIQVACFLKG